MSKTFTADLEILDYILNVLWPSIQQANGLYESGECRSWVDKEIFKESVNLQATRKTSRMSGGEALYLRVAITLGPTYKPGVYVLNHFRVFMERKGGLGDSLEGLLDVETFLLHIGKKFSQIASFVDNPKSSGELYVLSSPDSLVTLLRRYASLAKYYGNKPIFEKLPN